ncbi:MAG: tetratricopeptide repeat protein [Desulfatibacillum sp.]|nr:tetratricopeptide repeat protein [Desulfatibacillum sp.]
MRALRTELLLCLGLLALVAAVYHRIPQADFFLLDDSRYVIENPNMHLGLSWEGIKWAFTTDRGGFWIPLTWLSLLADAQVYGLNPGGFHLTNLLFHIANTLLLFWVLRRMTGSVFKSAFVAALFGVHPMHVESVAWITERKDVLFGFFWMLSVWAYSRYMRKPGLLTYLPIAFFFTMGLMAKPMIVTLPFVFLLLDYWPLGRLAKEDFSHPGKKALFVIGEKIPLLGIACAFSTITFFLQQQADALSSIEALSLRNRGANALVAYATYLFKTFWPFDIAVYYPLPDAPAPWWTWGGALALLLLVTAGVFALKNSKQYLFTGWFLFLGVLFPVIGISQSGPQAMAARFMYIPAIGLYIMIAWGVPDLLARVKSKTIILAVAAIFATLTAAALGYAQANLWLNGISLMTHSLKITGDNSFGYEIMGATSLSKGDNEAATKYLEMALELNPNNEKALRALSSAMESQGKMEEAIKYCERAVEVRPDYVTTISALGILYLKSGNMEKGRECLNKTLELPSDHFTTSLNLGTMYFLLGDHENALVHFKKAISMNPSLHQAHSYMAAIFLEAGEEEKAIEEYQQAVKFKPNLPQVHNRLGLLFAKKGQARLAAMHFDQARNLDPDFTDATYNLAYLLFQLHSYPQAQLLLQEIIQKSPESADAISLLELIQTRKQPGS